MKILLTALCVTLSFNVQAEDVYTAPSVLPAAEVKQAELAMEKNRVAIRKHWQDRLKAAQENENESEMAEIDTPLKKPSLTGAGHEH